MSYSDQRSEQKVNLYDYLYIIFRWRRFFLINLSILIGVVLLVTLLMPNWYKSQAVLLLPEGQSPIAGIPQLVRDFAPMNVLGRLGATLPSERYLAVLNSRRVMESVVNAFNLTEVYGIRDQSMEKTIKRLRRNSSFKLDDDGTILIEVFDRDPVRAADMANFFTAMLDSVLISLDTQEARSNRIFIERRYHQVRSDLAMVEDSLKAFQERHGVYALPEQTEVAIKAAAELQSLIYLSEIELGMMERSMGTMHPQVSAKRIELEELRKKLQEAKFGPEHASAEETLRLFIPFRDVPELGLQYIRLFREVELHSKILQLIVPMYEQAKIEEQKDIPQILVLDQAVPAERKTKPYRTVILLASAILGLFVCAFFVFFMESFRYKNDSQNPLITKLHTFLLNIERKYRIR